MKKKTVCAVMLAVKGWKVLADEQRVKLIKKLSVKCVCKTLE